MCVGSLSTNKTLLISTLHKNVYDESVAAKQVVEVINNTSSTVLEKATKEDIVGFQAYIYHKKSTNHIAQKWINSVD